jgi:hypothetical protein
VAIALSDAATGPSNVVIRPIISAFALGFILFNLGCGGSGSVSKQVEIEPTLTLTVTPSSLSFGNAGVGSTSSPQTVTVSASGGSVSVTAVAVQPSNCPFQVSNVATLPVVVSTALSLTFQVSFAPTAAGAASCTVNVTSDASNSPNTVSLSGTGTIGLTASTTSLNFGNVTIDTTSSPLSIILTAAGEAATINSITAPEPFKVISPLSLPISLSSGQTQTVQVTFTPSATGAASGTLTVTSIASSAPVTVSLSGMGTEAQAACAGETIAQTQTNVTSQLGILSSVVVTRLTSAPAPFSSWNTYADVPLVSTATTPNVMVTNYGTNPNGISMANADGTNAQTINGSQQGVWAVVSNDGEWVVYQGQNSDQTADLYGVNLTASGSCAPVNLSNHHLTLTAPATALIYSTSQIDPATGNDVFAFSEGISLHTVESDGSNYQTISLSDPYSSQVFHRLRLNPVFANKIWYKRDAANPNPNGTATPEIWVADITQPSVVYNSAIVGGTGVAADHNSWSPDGTSIGFVYNGLWYTITVLNSTGTWANGGSFASATLVGPPAASNLAVDYCSWAPDGSEYVCAQGPDPSMGFTGLIYLMSLDGKTTTPLAYAGSTGSVDDGIPKPHFGDMQHIYFSSDLSGVPQVYVITGFPSSP